MTQIVILKSKIVINRQKQSLIVKPHLAGNQRDLPHYNTAHKAMREQVKKLPPDIHLRYFENKAQLSNNRQIKPCKDDYIKRKLRQ